MSSATETIAACPVIGAWTWLEDYGFGVATEQDVAEAFQPLYVLREAIWAMFALLVAAAVAIFIFTIVVARAKRAVRRAAMEAMQLGQYTLDEKLGEGGMGVVYRAHHAMLQRPTAVKFIGSEKTNEQTMARFEREVQLTAKLKSSQYHRHLRLRPHARGHFLLCDGVSRRNQSRGSGAEVWSAA